MADIFLSYARADRDKVRGLVPILEAQGWSVFWDAAIEPGQRWDNLIAAELEGARCVVVIWTQASVLSDWVKDEATRGREREVLVPVSLDGTRAPLGFRHVQIESIGDWSSPASEPALQRFLAGVRRIVGSAPQALSPVEGARAQDDAADLHEAFHFDPAPDGSFVVDYVTECGDSFASTYAMAYLISTQPVRVDPAQIVAPGGMLVLGVNSPDRAPSLAQYEQALIAPYARAYGSHAKARRALFGVPGFHRSPTAMAHFDELFCGARSRAARGLGLSFGGWDTHQHHRFFAVPLPHRWWIWGVDLRYGQRLETEQFNYFSLASEQMTGDDRIIVCGPPDNWLSSEFDGWREQQNLQRLVAVAESAGARVVALITGGRREYARSTVADKAVELFEVGGGRSFVYPSHLQASRTLVRWQAPVAGAGDAHAVASVARPASVGQSRRAYEEDHHFWFLNKRAMHSIAEDVRLGAASAIYWAENPPAPEIAEVPAAGAPPSVAATRALLPSRARSAALLFRNLLFPWSNRAYAVVWGLIYWLITWQFHGDVSRYEISAGKIDGLGLSTGLMDVLPFLPLYLVQAMIADIGLVITLSALLAGLVLYVEPDRGSGFVRSVLGLLIGGTHWLAHVAAMFMLSLLVVMSNNLIAPVVERQLEQAYKREQAPIVRDVIEESLAPPTRQNERRTAPAPEVTRPSPVRELVGFTTYPISIVAVGALLSGAIWGLYLSLTGLLGRRFAEKAFAMLRLKGYRSFLRLRITADELTIYPVGLGRLPSARSWRRSGEYGAATEYLPRRPLAAELIERPVVIRAARKGEAR